MADPFRAPPDFLTALEGFAAAGDPVAAAMLRAAMAADARDADLVADGAPPGAAVAAPPLSSAGALDFLRAPLPAGALAQLRTILEAARAAGGRATGAAAAGGVALSVAMIALLAVRDVATQGWGPAFVAALQSEMSRRKSTRRAAVAQPWDATAAIGYLSAQPPHLSLFGALRLMEGACRECQRLGYSRRLDEDPIRIDQALLMGFAANEVEAVGRPDDGGQPWIRQAAVGLLGPNGVLPLVWTEFAHDLMHAPYRSRSDPSFLAWINLLQRRHLALLYRAWADAQAVIGAERPQHAHPLGDRLVALGGFALPRLADGDEVPPSFKKAFAATLARRVRSPVHLEAALAHFFGAPVRVREFAARWIEIPEAQQTRLGVQFHRLGQDAIAGARVWDCTSRFRIYVGPIGLAQYRAFLPSGTAYAQLLDLVSLYAGPEYEWELIPILAHDEVPLSWLGNAGLLLGWSSWLGVRYDDDDAADLNLHMAPRFGVAAARREEDDATVKRPPRARREEYRYAG
ncbi:MAG: type VI secretion system baseplate subunit TssG [Betaproteobacteria bacterium]